MLKKIVPVSVFLYSALIICFVAAAGFLSSPLIYAQDVLNSVQQEQFGMKAELKNDGSLWVRDYKNEKGEVQVLTVFDISEEILLSVTKKNTKADVTDADVIARFNIFGKPVIVCKYGVFAFRRLSMETIFDHIVWPVEITNANALAYPGKEGWGIIEINGKKELVIYQQRGSDTLIRPYKAGKDPS